MEDIPLLHKRTQYGMETRLETIFMRKFKFLLVLQAPVKCRMQKIKDFSCEK